MRKRLDLRSLTTSQALAALTLAAMLPMLLYNWRHTSSLFARYIDPDWYALGVAFGIEVSVFVLALRLGQQRMAGKDDKRTVAILAGALFVSAIANVLEGYAVQYGQALTIANVRAVDPIQAVGWLAATGLISVLVFALSNVIGGDVRKAAQVAERQERKAAQDVEQPQDDASKAVAVATVLTLPKRWTCSKCGASFDVSQRYAAHMRHGCGKDAAVKA